MSEDPVDLTPDDDPMHILEASRDLNMKRYARLVSQGHDPMIVMLFHRINFCMDSLVGPIEQSPERMKMEVFWESQVLPTILTAIESALIRQQLTAQPVMDGDQLRKIIDPRSN